MFVPYSFPQLVLKYKSLGLIWNDWFQQYWLEPGDKSFGPVYICSKLVSGTQLKTDVVRAKTVSVRHKPDSRYFSSDICWGAAVLSTQGNSPVWLSAWYRSFPTTEGLLWTLSPNVRQNNWKNSAGFAAASLGEIDMSIGIHNCIMDCVLWVVRHRHWPFLWVSLSMWCMTQRMVRAK